MIPEAAITQWARKVPWPTLMYLRALYESGAGNMRIKIEVNTYERTLRNSPIRIPHSVDSSWFSGGAEVLTFTPEELVATKIRALFQRSKGRDLFDMWLALARLSMSGSLIAEAFEAYRPEEYTRRRAELNLREKIKRPAFRDDLRPLVTAWPKDYDVGNAGELVISEVLSHIP